MECRTTSIDRRQRRNCAGALLPEAIMAIGITGILMVILTSFTMFSGRSFAALFNYVTLNDVNRVAIDYITQDVRQARRVTAASTDTLSLEDSDGSTLTYRFLPSSRTLVRIKNGASRNILTDCDNISFSLGQRNPVNGTYDVYPAATPATCKVVNVSWVCSRTIFGNKENSESVQTARIVIRKQGS